MIKLSKKNFKVVDDTLSKCSQDNLLTIEQYNLLKQNIEILSFDWKKLSKISFLIAIICVVISIGTFFTNEYIINLINKLFVAPATIKSLFFGLFSIIFYLMTLYRRRNNPEKIYSNNAILLLGVLSTATSVGYFGKAIDISLENLSLLILTSSVIYGIIAISFQSVMVWVFSLISLGGWLGAEAGYLSKGLYYLGINLPVRFLLFGTSLLILARNLKHFNFTKILFKSTFNISMLYIFISLWFLSIFGNDKFGFNLFHALKSTEIFFWSLLFAIAALIAIWYGLKNDDSSSRKFGMVFLLINLYTKYFENFWDIMDKTAFFATLAISFWGLATKSEYMWRFLNKKNEY